VVDKLRQRLGTQKYNVSREHSLEQTVLRHAVEPAARQPTPSQVAIANERWELFLKDQPAHYRQVLELLRQGHTHQEIATRLGLNEKTVRRLVRKLDSEAVHDAT
jgi:RNA polymerase sigma-70 factor (ECF subfamily)